MARTAEGFVDSVFIVSDTSTCVSIGVGVSLSQRRLDALTGPG